MENNISDTPYFLNYGSSSGRTENSNLRRSRKSRVSRWDSEETNIKRVKNNKIPSQSLLATARFPDTAPVFFSGCSNLDVSTFGHNDATLPMESDNMHSQWSVLAGVKAPVCAPASSAIVSAPSNSSAGTPYPSNILPPDVIASKKLTQKGIAFGFHRLYPPEIRELPLPERPPFCKTVTVGGFPDGTADYILKEVFKRFGVIDDIEMIMSDIPNQNLCHIRYVRGNEAVRAMSLSEYDIQIEKKGETKYVGKLLVQYAETQRDKADYEHECKIRADNREKHYNPPSVDSSNDDSTGEAPLCVSGGMGSSSRKDSAKTLCPHKAVPLDGGKRGWLKALKIRTKFPSCSLYLPHPSLADIRQPPIRPVGCKTISVGGFPEGTTEDILQEIFEQFGTVDHIETILSDDPNQNFCHIRFDGETAVERAIVMTEFVLKIPNQFEQNCKGKLLVQNAETPQDKAEHELECQIRAYNRERRHNQPSPEASVTLPVVSGNDMQSCLPLATSGEIPLCTAVSNNKAASPGDNCNTAPYPPVVTPLDVNKCGGVSKKFTKNQTVFPSCSLYPPTNDVVQPTCTMPIWCKTIFVGGLPLNVTKAILREIFEQFGAIDEITCPNAKFCYIRYENARSIEPAMSLSGCILKIGDKDEMGYIGTLRVKGVADLKDKAEFEREHSMQALHRHMRRHGSISYSTYAGIGLTESLRVLYSFNHFREVVAALTGWFERGECTKINRGEFFSWILGCISHVRRLQAEVDKEETALQVEMEAKKKSVEKKCQDALFSYREADKVFKAVLVQKVWDHFSKQQRKNIECWMRECEELKNATNDKLLDFRVEEDMALSDVEEECLDNLVTEKKEGGGSVTNVQDGSLNNVVTERNKIIFEGQKIQLDDVNMLRNQLSALQREVEDYKQNNAILQRKLIQLLQSGKEMTDGKNGGAHTISNNVNHSERSVKSPNHLDITQTDVQLVAVISAYLFTLTEGASVDCIYAYVKDTGVVVGIKDISDLLQRFSHIFKEECDKKGETLHRWKFVGHNFQIEFPNSTASNSFIYC